MGRGYSGDLANAQIVLLLQLLVIVCCSSLARSAECKIQLCSRQYARTVEEGNISKGATYRYCSVLKSYSECVRTTARQCRGDLDYHSVQSLVVQWTRTFDCPRVLERGPQPMPHPRPQGGKHKLQKQPHQECSHYRPGGALTHCGLFGDPHLRTFYDELQTCSIPGAWPLLDNPHLAVQVTNDPVGKGTVATAITKVTVIIRQHVPCAIEKTYEAQAYFLPGVFADGSRWSGPGVRIHEEVPGKHIELNFRYINTRIIIRQSGSYLTFAARMPSAIAVQGAQENTLELCVRGCPRRERIDFERVLETSTGPKNEAIAACRALNITDFYFDACVFDYLTTGDDSFSVAARDAMMDIGPQSVVNGSLPVMPRSVESGQKSTMHPFPMLFVVLGLMWFFLVNR